MRYLVEKTSNISTLIENQFPHFVQENNSTFIKFLTSYYESLESKYQPLDIAANLVDYYSIGYYTPSQLVKNTTLTQNLSASATSVFVSSTAGFPEKNGYIKIDSEIIFYKSKTPQAFHECVRGTSALILENVPKSEIVLVKSTSSDHKKGVEVENIAYLYAREFFSRIKSEIAPFIPEVLVSELNISDFLKRINSFYRAKGSLNSHRMLFKILFNDKKFKFLLKKPFLTEAKLKINNYAGEIPTNPPPTIISGGSGYDYRKSSNGNLLNPPIIDILGSGTGERKSSGLQPNDSAIVVVKDINSSGAITELEVLDKGKEYVGPINSRVRPRSFKQDQIVYNSSGTGRGRVDFWDGFSNELILYDVIGYFKSGDEIISDSGEKPRAFIDKALAETQIINGTPIVKSFEDGVTILSEEQNIEFPQEYTFKTSNSQLNKKNILRCKLVGGELVDIQKNKGAYTLVQDKDSRFGIKGVLIEVDNVISLRNNEYEFEISTNSDINDIYLNPSTVVTLQTSSVNNSSTFIVTVDDASRFPITNGIILIGNRQIHYKHRSFNQFFECKYFGTDTFNIDQYDEVVSWGRKLYDLEWVTGLQVKEDTYIVSNNNLYKATNSGKTGSIKPSHTTGKVADGSFDSGDTDFVVWEYVSSNILKHYTYITYKDPIVKENEIASFYVIGLPGDIEIEDGGCLHSTSVYEFVNFDSPNTNMYRFVDTDLSNSLAALLSYNFNRTRSTVTDSRLPSFGSLTGFSTQHDFDEYIYVPSSAIPPWWNSIIPNLPAGTISSNNYKKLSFTNQKLLSRWKKSGLLYETQAIGTKQPTKKSIGLDISAIQVNSYKGNTIEFGFIDRFIIGDGGKYKVPIKSTVDEIDRQKLPKIIVNENISVSGDVIRLNSKVLKINFNTLAEEWSKNSSTSSNLSGFSSKPSIVVENRNPVNIFQFNKSDITFDTQSLNHNTFVLTVSTSNESTLLKTSDEVTILGPYVGGNISNTVMPELFNGMKAYVRESSRTTSGSNILVRYSLHKSVNDAILNQNKISLQYVNTPSQITVSLITNEFNPINFSQCELSLSYNEANGIIDNIIINNSGNGYVEAPTIYITGGGKLNNDKLVIPYKVNGKEIIELEGKITSYNNFYLENDYEINKFDQIDTSFNSAPKVVVDCGSEAEAVAYTSNGRINSVIVIRRGKNYFVDPTVTIVSEGRDSSIHEDAVVKAIISNGEIVGFNIEKQGTGYNQQVKVIITPAGSGASVSCRLKEWNFNLVHRFTLMDRIDRFGGYVYDSGDVKDNTTNNPKEFDQIDKKNDLPSSADDKQYLLLKPTERLIIDYTKTQRNPLIKPLYPSRDLTANPLDDAEVRGLNIHSPAIAVSYDGIPIYGNKGHSVRYDSTSSIVEIKSRYKLKYSTTSTTSSQSFTYNGTTYYVNRIGGPSIDEYPIGSFIEDYEYVAGGISDLDEHNGRFCVTPEFPLGRYCYFSTLSSYDAITNYIIEASGLNYNGFPYYIGNQYASIPDNYTNSGCRTNDKIPSVFTRVFEKNIPPFKINGVIDFAGLPKNDFYPTEKTNFDKTKIVSKSILPGTVDSVIIESAGTGYRFGDTLEVDNSLTGGTGFSGFVSKISGKNIVNVFRPVNVNDFSIEFETGQNHNLSSGDYVYFNYSKNTTQYEVTLHGVRDDQGVLQPVSSNVEPSQNITAYPVKEFENKQVYTLFLNYKFNYLIKLAANQSYKVTYDIEKNNEYFISTPSANNTLSLDAEKIPNILYLHIGSYIYEIVKSYDFDNRNTGYPIQRISDNKFKIDFTENTRRYEIRNLSYTTRSRSANGSIVEISISNKGSGYRKLPVINRVISESVSSDGTVTEQGSGAIIQAYSSTIGKLRNFRYSNVGGGLVSNLNVNYNIDLPSTAKIINNFEIYEVEVVNGGFGYGSSVDIKVDDQFGLARFDITVQTGIITAVRVLFGGSNFSKTPTLTVVAPNGSGAILRAKIRRKNIFQGEKLTLSPTQPYNSINFPVSVNCEVINFDQKTSTIEFNEIDGEFKDNDLLYTSDGLPYGKILKVKRSKAYSKVSPYIKLESTKKDVYGNTSEYLQRITDSNFYQDWSYLISSSRDVNDWRREVLLNTHPSGHRLFGKKVIERRKFFFDKPEDVFKSSVIFTTNLNNVLDLNLKITPCKRQTITLNNISYYSENNYIYGTTSESIAKVTKVNEESMVVEIQNGKPLITGEVVVKVPPLFAYGVISNTFRHLAIWESVLQEPEYSYEAAMSDVSGGFAEDVIVPKFNVSSGEKILNYKLTTPYSYYDSIVANKNTDKISFSIDGLAQAVTQNTIGNFIISVGGSIQDPSKLSVSNGIVTLGETVKYDDTRIFAISHSEFKRLIFTGPSVSNEYTLNYTITDNCNLLVFYSGVSQSHLITSYQIVNGNTIRFSENIDKDKLFGWYINESVSCRTLLDTDFINFRVTSIRGCTTNRFSKFIHSSVVKHPSSLYEIRKELLDGTVYADPDRTTVYGFDSNFTYTSPKYSRSLVEVVDPIQFNGSTKTFSLKLMGTPYTPKNGKNSTIVYINNNVLDSDSYSIVNDTITFVNTYVSSDRCIIADFVSNYTSNVSKENCETLDRLNVVQNGVRKTFNLSNNGVPFYARNPGDVFVVENNKLKRPELKSYKQKQDSETESIVANKFTFVNAPLSSDTVDLVYFNRQLEPEPTKNVILDDFRCYNGIRTQFPLTLDGKLYYPQYTKNLFIIRNGVYQKPEIDYYISGCNVVFTTAPVKGEVIFTYYSFDGLNQNIFIDTFKKFDGIQKDFALTRNFISSYLDNDYDIMVYRNGVYQHPGSDYTVLNKQTGPYIRFITAPVPTDDIYIINFNLSNNDDLIDVTSRFTQVNPTTIVYNTASPNIDKDVFIVFLNGIMQTEDSWSYNDILDEITFDEPVSLSSNKINIFAFKTKKRNLKTTYTLPLDQFKKFDGVQTKFALTNNFIETSALDEINLQVYRNGVYQYPNIDYVIGISNNESHIVGQNSAQYIEFTTAPNQGDKIFINNVTTDDIIDITSRFLQTSSTTLTYQLTLPITDFDDTNLLIYINGTLQNGSSYAWNPYYGEIIFGQSINFATDKVVIYGFKTKINTSHEFKVLKLDEFKYFNSITTEFPLSFDNNNSPVDNISCLHVFRNGVFQYENIDYTINSIGISSGWNSIDFTTAPDEGDDIFIIYYPNNYSDYIENVTNRFSQISPTELQYNSGSSVDTNLFIIYINGVYQTRDAYNFNSNILTFDQDVDLINDKIVIYGFENAKEELDTITIQQSVSTYTLTLNSLPVTVMTETDIIVVIDGVVQRPIQSYTVSGNTITLNNSNQNIGSEVKILYLGQYFNSFLVDEIDNNFSKKQFSLYNSLIPYFQIYGNDTLTIYKNGTKLIPNTDYTCSPNFVTFTNFLTKTDNIEIYVGQYRVFYSPSNSLNSEDFIVNLNGVVQQPNVSYTIFDDYILQLQDPKSVVNDTFYVYEIGFNTIEIVDYLDDNYDKKTFKLSSNYVYYNVNDSGNIFVYKNGQLLINNVDYTYGSGYITFVNPIAEIDRIFISSYNYNLIDQSNNSTITTNLPNTEEDLLISINGVCQKPNASYEVNGSTLTLLNAPELVVPTDYSLKPVYIYQVGTSSDDVSIMDYLDDNYLKSTYKLANSYKSFYPPNIGDIFILRNGVLQNPVEDFVIGNGYITFTTNITEQDDLFIMYTHGAQEIGITNITSQTFTLSNTISSSEYKNVILNINGAPKFHMVDFTISGNLLTLNEPLSVDPGTTPFVLKYPSITFVDNINDCPDGQKTRFKLLYTFPNGNLTNLVENDIKSHADILVSVNGIVQYPGVQYTINSIRTFVDFAVAPQETDEIFFVRMSGNEVVNMSLDSGMTYSLSSATQNNLDNLVVFSNNQWKFEERSEFAFSSNRTKVTLSQSNTSQYVFGIKFTGVFGLLDQINTPYNGSRRLFNMFVDQENFVPNGTILDDTTPDETSLLVVKNGKILDPKVDYVLSGDIESQILFSTAPISSDVINVKSVGSFLKLDTITTGFGGKVFDLKLNGNDYYPNSDISRPREHENQILVIRNGDIQNPIYDYYIDNNKLVFNNNLPVGTTKLVILDFRGSREDVEVFNRYNQISVGDEIYISGENSPRKVTTVLSPTVLKTESYTGVMPSGAVASATYDSGKVTDINVTNGGIGYEHPAIFRTKGSGVGAKAVANVEYYDGGIIRDDSVSIQYPGHNVYSPQTVVTTAYANSYKQQPLVKSQIRKATKLSSNINSTTETISLRNTSNMASNSPSITVSSLTGSGAQFKIFVSNGSIRKVEIVNSGIGYDDRSIDIELVGGGGSGCVLEPVLDAMGRFTNVIIRNGGIGYDTFRVIIFDPSDTSIDPEFIEYTYVTPSGIDGCTRGSGAESYSADTMVYFDSYL